MEKMNKKQMLDPQTIKYKIDQRHEELKSIIHATKIDASYAYDTQKLLDEKIKYMVENCKSVLDFGQSSRNRYQWFAQGQAETADINQFEGYPDRFVDICDSTTFPEKKYDGIICNAVIEHVYEPAIAVKNMYDALEDDGICLCYAPFIFRYHAPPDLMFQDYFRYTKDGLSYLFRDFSEVTLYPVLGRSSAGISFIFPWWKYKVEKRFPKLAKWIDRFLGGVADKNQTRGYLIWAKK